jgi:hypothetical protein
MTATTNQPEITADQAQSELFNRVFDPVYFSKLASFGIHPNTDEDVVTLRELGLQLLELDNQAQAQNGAQASSMFKAASEDLQRLLGKQPAQPDESAVLAQQLMARDPALVKFASVLVN